MRSKPSVLCSWHSGTVAAGTEVCHLESAQRRSAILCVSRIEGKNAVSIRAGGSDSHPCIGIPYRAERILAVQPISFEVVRCQFALFVSAWDTLLFQLRTSENADMPSCNRFLMSLPLEQFFSAVLLGI